MDKSKKISVIRRTGERAQLGGTGPHLGGKGRRITSSRLVWALKKKIKKKIVSTEG
jgi:hypothetical protein